MDSFLKITDLTRSKDEYNFSSFGPFDFAQGPNEEKLLLLTCFFKYYSYIDHVLNLASNLAMPVGSLSKGSVTKEGFEMNVLPHTFLH